MCKRTYILGAIYIIGNRVYVNCMCNHEKHVPIQNSWFYQLPHESGDSFPLCSFSFLQKKNFHFWKYERKEGKKYGNQNKKSGQRDCGSHPAEYTGIERATATGRLGTIHR